LTAFPRNPGAWMTTTAMHRCYRQACAETQRLSGKKAILKTID